jgi:hypothetical protein
MELDEEVERAASLQVAAWPINHRTSHLTHLLTSSEQFLNECLTKTCESGGTPAVRKGGEGQKIRVI